MKYFEEATVLIKSRRKLAFEKQNGCGDLGNLREANRSACHHEDLSGETSW